MKINIIFKETVQDEKRLDVIADQLLKAIRNHVINNKHIEKEDEIFYLGKIKDYVNSKVLGPHYNRLGRINFGYYINLDSNDHGYFDWSIKEITVNYPVEIKNNKIKKPPHNPIHSFIVHELRHALDYSLSKGKAFNDELISKASDIDPNDVEYDEYQKLKTEVNARTSQAMLLTRKFIINAINHGESLNNLLVKDIILDALEQENLINIFQSKQKIPWDNKSFRQLYKRMLKYAQDVLKQIENKN